jgi:predicted nucleotidyltransferase
MVWGLERARLLEERWLDIARLVLSTARRFADVKEAVVFGSVVKKRAVGNSDLDVALVVRGLRPGDARRLAVQVYLALPEEVSELVDIVIVDERDEEHFLRFASAYFIVRE